MALNYYVGWTQAELETKLRELQDQLEQRVTSVGTGDFNSSMFAGTSIETAMERVLRALYALDPTTYPITSIVRTNRTKAAIQNA